MLMSSSEVNCNAEPRPSSPFLADAVRATLLRARVFFDSDVLSIVRGAMDDRVVADQWGCDAPVEGSIYQDFHVDYQRPLFAELPDLPLPMYMLNVSFGLVPIGSLNGPLEIAPGTHRMRRTEALQAVQALFNKVRRRQSRWAGHHCLWCRV